MEEDLEICQTCLSSDRFLYPFTDLKDFSRVLHIEIKQKSGFGICWECKRLFEKFSCFRAQVLKAQALLNSNEKVENLKPLSALSIRKKYYNDSYLDPITKVLVTCTEAGPILIKQEITDNTNDCEGVTEASANLHNGVEENVNLHNGLEANVNLHNGLEENVIGRRVLDKNYIEGDYTKSNESGTNNKEIDEHTNISKLPRITLVESLTESHEPRTAQPGTEIELNIPVSHTDDEGNIPTANTNIRVADANVPIANGLNTVATKRAETEDPSVVLTCKNVVASKTVLDPEAITVKVIYKECVTEVHGVRIKEEPVSEPEDMDDPIMLNHAEETRVSANVNISARALVSKLASLTSEVKREPQTADELQNHILWKKSILLVYNRIRAHKYASRFLHPVTDAAAPGYSRVVRRPMDLNMIRRNVRDGLIRTTEEFERDVLLVISNALMYNSSDHYIYSMTKDLLEEVKYQLDLLLTINGDSSVPNDASRRRRLDIDLLSPPAKRSRIPTVKAVIDMPSLNPKTEKKAKRITPKMERKSVAAKTPKKITPKAERKSTATKAKKITPKMERKSIANKKPTSKVTAKKITPKVERKSIAVSKVTPKAKVTANKVDSTNKFMAKKIKTERKSIFCSAIERPVLTPEVKLEGIRRSSRIRTKSGVNRYSPSLLPNPVARCKVNRKQKISSTMSSTMRESTYNYTDTQSYLVPQAAKRRYGAGTPNSSTSAVPTYIDDILTGSQKDVDDLCVAITTEPQRDLSRDEASYLKKILEDKIMNIAFDSSDFAPRFRGKPIIADGVIKLWCDDKKSLEWLLRTISKLPKNIGKFVVRKQADLPKKIKSAIVVPGFNGEVEVILRLIKAQNPWAQVESWAVYSAEQRGESMILVLGIPNTIVPTLLDRQRRLAYSLGSVYVMFYDIGNKLSGLPPEV